MTKLTIPPVVVQQSDRKSGESLPRSQGFGSMQSDLPNLAGYIEQLGTPPSKAAAIAERNAWVESAAQFSRNEEYYRGLLDQIAEVIGTAAYTADDGSVCDSPVRAKLPELVRVSFAAYRVQIDRGTTHCLCGAPIDYSGCAPRETVLCDTCGRGNVVPEGAPPPPAALQSTSAQVGEGFKCAALTYQGQEPQDCNWPHCGCDPKATEVLQALDEHGHDLVDRHAKPASTPPARPTREEIARLSKAIDSIRGSAKEAPPGSLAHDLDICAPKRSSLAEVVAAFDALFDGASA